MGKMVSCKKCGKTFIDSKAKAGHVCDKIEPGTATLKKADKK